MPNGRFYGVAADLVDATYPLASLVARIKAFIAEAESGVGKALARGA